MAHPASPGSRTGTGRAPWVMALLLVLLAHACTPFGDGTRAQLPTASAVPSSRFTDSVGVNVHLWYEGTPYDQLPRVRQALRRLGVRHVREGLPPQRRPELLGRLQALADDGVQTQLILGSPGRRQGEPLAPVGPSLEALRAAGLRGVLSGVEGPNEWDLRGGPGWADQVRAYQQELYGAVRADPVFEGVPVVGPSLARRNRRTQLGDLTAALDRGNNHLYVDGGPTVEEARDELADAATVSGPEPVRVTETGYTNGVNDPEGKPPVTPREAAVYVPRTVAAFFRAGVERTFLYELLDQRADPGRVDDEANFGLLDVDLSPKPAFHALRRLLELTRATPGGVAVPGGHDLRVTSASPSVQQLLLDRGDGTLALLLWRDVDAGGSDATARGVRYTVRSALPWAEAALHRPSLQDGPVRVVTDSDELTGVLGADLQVVLLRVGQGQTAEGGAPALPIGALVRPAARLFTRVGGTDRRPAAPIQEHDLQPSPRPAAHAERRGAQPARRSRHPRRRPRR